MLNKLRSLRLTRKQRQLRFLAIILVLGTIVFNNLPTRTKADSVFLDDYEQIVITINEGDRAWNVQQELTPNEDIREILFHLKEINGKSTGYIQPGEKIIFLKTKDN